MKYEQILYEVKRVVVEVAKDAAVLNADDAHFGYLASRSRCRVVSFGLSRSAEVRATDVVADPRRGTAFRLTLPGAKRQARVILRAHGAHNLSNALAAAAVGHCLALGGATIARGLARFRPATMRSQVSRWGDLRIINDCYNANPASVRAALDAAVAHRGTRRLVVVLGDMLELGPVADEAHRARHHAEPLDDLPVEPELAGERADGAGGVHLGAAFPQSSEQAFQGGVQQAELFHLLAAGLGNALVGTGSSHHLPHHLLDGVGGLARHFPADLDLFHHHPHGGGDLVHPAAQLADDVVHLRRRMGSALGELAHLVRHDRKAAPLLASARRFHGGVERQDVGLEGDAIDDADDVCDLA